MSLGSVSRWTVIGLGLYLSAVLLVVLLPVGYSDIVVAIGDVLHQRLGLVGFGYGWVEFAGNVVMAMPIGFFLAAMLRRFWPVVGLALVASVAIELLQLIIPSRTASVRDVLANTAGAAIGAAVGSMVTRRKAALRNQGCKRGLKPPASSRPRAT